MIPLYVLPRQNTIPLLLFLLMSFFPVVAQDSLIILGSGNYSTMTVNTSDNNGNGTGTETVNGFGLLPNLNSSSRFLAQSTLGADMETITATAGKSYTEWLEEQFNTPISASVQQYTQDITVAALDSTFAAGGDPNLIAPQRWFWHSAWWKYTMESPDILRNRIALALSEIFVVSEMPQLDEVPLSLANYYDMLLENSFGNFRDLLEDITYHPAMGLYLTHVNNPKSEPSLNRFPDENYAREIMQLFTIGLYELNNDGTRKLDGSGNFIPTYDNYDIAEFAKIFTGMTYWDTFLFGQNPQSEQSFLMPMQLMNNWHEAGPKTLLDGTVIPDRNPVDGYADVTDALDHLFNHPNVGPFIGHKLIQRLVKSNPSPEYVGRVASAFNNNGSGVRGDMKALIKAVLLDPEARSCYVDDPFTGMLREPIVRYTQLCRAFNAYNLEGFYRSFMGSFYENTLQRPLGSPTVFNFFQPDYQPIGDVADNDLVAPEFQITNSVTILGYAKELHYWIMNEYDVHEWFQLYIGEPYNLNKTVNIDLTDELALGTDDKLGELIERLNTILVHGQMSDETKDIIMNTITQLDETQAELRVRLALYLTMISPDYLILR